jgi:hypothetical protein
MTSPADTSPTGFPLPVLRLRSPADVVEAVPYLVGFHPERSIVVLCLSRRHKELTLSMRLDLPPAGDAREAARLLSGHVRGSGGDLVLIACYPEGADQRESAQAMVDELCDCLPQPILRVKEAVRVEDGRWWSYLCRNPQCCPAEGTPVAATPTEVGAVAVLNGRVALPSRATLAERLRPVNVIAGRAVEQALAEVRPEPSKSSWAAFTAELLGRYEQGCGRMSPQEVARLLAGLQDVRLRDACVDWWYDPGRTAATVPLWTDAVRLAPPGYVAAPATLLGISAWLEGEGAFGNIALDRALADDPGYRLALLMDAVIQRGVSPSQFRAARFAPAPASTRTRGRARRRRPLRR